MRRLDHKQVVGQCSMWITTAFKHNYYSFLHAQRHTVMGFPEMDVAVCPNEQREYTGTNSSELLIWPHVHACQGKCVSKCVTFCDVFMSLPMTTCENGCPQCMLADVNVYDCETGRGSHDER